MIFPVDDTIAAISSAPDGAARGVIRLSGPDVTACLQRIFQPTDGEELAEPPEPSVTDGSLRMARGESGLPCQLYFWPAGHGYTGQPAAELHVLGCPPLLDAVLESLCTAEARLAEPGEFTLRAFLTGRLDLTQAEAVLGLIDATDSARFDVALTQLAGGMARPLHELRDALIDLLASLEAGFDFADEDIEFISPTELIEQLNDAATAVERLAQQMRTRRDTAASARVTLIGWPNSGKSSLFNALIGNTAGALVSEEAGTTTDYLTAEINPHGVRFLLVDTAGVEPDCVSDGTTPEATVARAAQAATEQQSHEALLRVVCLDSTRELNAWERDLLAQETDRRLVVLTKSDGTRRTNFQGHAMATSAFTGEGFDELGRRIHEMILTDQTHGSDVVASTAVRCHESLRQAGDSLRRAQSIATSAAGDELVATELRIALDNLGKVVGAVYTDDILDRVFSRFCVGK